MKNMFASQMASHIHTISEAYIANNKSYSYTAIDYVILNNCLLLLKCYYINHIVCNLHNR